MIGNGAIVSGSIPVSSTRPIGIAWRGAQKTLLKGNTFVNSRSGFFGSAAVTDAAGSAATLTPTYLSDKSNDWIDIQTDTVPVVTVLTTPKVVLRDNHDTAIQFPSYDGGQPVSLTIASGAITIPITGATAVVVDTQASAASDDLDTINGGIEGCEITLYTANNSRDVTVTRLVGNIFPGPASVTLSNVLDKIVLRKTGTTWVAVGASENG